MLQNVPCRDNMREDSLPVRGVHVSELASENLLGKKGKKEKNMTETANFLFS